MLLALHGALVDGTVVLCGGNSLRGRTRVMVHLSTLMYFSLRLQLLIRSSVPKFSHETSQTIDFQDTKQAQVQF